MAADGDPAELPALEDEVMGEKDDVGGGGEGASGGFSKVKRKRKRRVREMEVEGPEAEGDQEERATAAKRPSFPPVDASTTLVSRLSSKDHARIVVTTGSGLYTSHELFIIISPPRPSILGNRGGPSLWHLYSLINIFNLRKILS